MSLGLVAYGASDDSDESENEYENASVSAEQSSQSNAISGHISDEDDFQTVSSSTSAPIFANRLESKSKDVVTADTSTTAFFNAKNYDNNVNSTSLTSLEDLPAPQLLSASLSANIVEGELEEEVKPKASEIANAQLPPTKKAKQPVKITIPSLNEVEVGESDSDKSTAASSTSKKTGLFSLLPAPMHSVKKELNRPLIPHTLTKKPPVSNKSPSVQGNNLLSSTFNSASQKNKETDFSTKHMTPFNALTGFESDSDDEEFTGSGATNFFSLQSTSGTTRNTADATNTHDKLQIEEISSSGTETSPAANEVPNRDSSDVGNEESESVAALPPGPEPGALNDAPLDFGRINQLRSWPGSSYGFLPPVGPSGPITHGTSSSYETSLSVPSNSQYNLANAEDEDKLNAADQEAMDEDDAMKLINDKEFQRLQGKRKRGMEEAINFVDANVDDYVDPSEVSKHLTEESSYVSHKNKDNMPTAQQRRKKQITYLAYQAKEREMELKNTWAQNRLTKKQTQSKYGF